MTDKKIKLIALDLDGTTFTSEKTITKKTAETIAEAIRRGCIVMPSTGRPRIALPQDFTSIPGVRYALTSNGGAVWDLEKDEIIYGAFFDYETACKVIDALIVLDALVEIYHSGICYADQLGYDRTLNVYENMPKWFKAYVKVSRTPVKDLRKWVYSGELQIEKFLVSFDDQALRSRTLAQMAQMPEVQVSYGNEFNMEVNSKDGSKGQSLLAFAKGLGISADEIMVCGDTENDRSVMQAAGLAVAMGNAEPAIKAMADYVTLSNDEDGVAAAIRRFVLEPGLDH